ncbi:MAG: formylmethanofuran dehydrogenase subunit C [Gammaproteobacteria bacterium]
MISITLKATPSAIVDAAWMTPAAFTGHTLKQIQRLPLRHGGDRVRLADLFEVSGSADDTLEINDASASLHGLGSDMAAGKLVINGDAGDYLGREMRGGEIYCVGNTGVRAGAGMRRGRLEIRGSVGEFAGGCTPGATSGMKGGVILVGKDAGARLGDRMRRGTIMVRGNAGAHSGSQMIAGTLALLGSTAPGLGSGMRRGTLLVADPETMVPGSFVRIGQVALPFVTVLCRYLIELKPQWRRALDRFALVERWVGDRGCDGLGEILLARSE